MARGKGSRCVGFAGGDGWTHCSREEFAGNAKFHKGSESWSHRLEGDCPCGVTHRAAAYEGVRRRDSRPAAEVRQIGEARGAKIVATYAYQNTEGALLYEVVRTDPKSFRQRRPDGKGGWIWNMKGRATTLYRLPELRAALQAGDPIYVVEGEKDVEALRKAGSVATCNSGGAGKWRDELAGAFTKFLDPRNPSRIRIVQDRDDPGRQHARAVYDSLAGALTGFWRVRENKAAQQEAQAAGQKVDSNLLAIVEPTDGKDAADHLSAGQRVEDFRQVWPISSELLQRDPQAFKRYMIRAALDTPPEALDVVEPERERHQQPLYPVGLVGGKLLRHLQGVTVVAGEPSSGKSYLAMSTAVDAAANGWDVRYLSCEMHEYIPRDRMVRAMASYGIARHEFTQGAGRTAVLDRARRMGVPENPEVVNVEAGVTIRQVMEYLAESVTGAPTLVILDSVSSFVDNLEEERGDSFGMGHLRRVIAFVTSVRRLTHGHVAFLLLSELNKEGRAKGRFVDHRSDIAISMRSNEEHGHLKTIKVTKSWWGPTGPAGEFILDWELGRLRDEDGPAPDAHGPTDSWLD